MLKYNYSGFLSFLVWGTWQAQFRLVLILLDTTMILVLIKSHFLCLWWGWGWEGDHFFNVCDGGERGRGSLFYACGVEGGSPFYACGGGVG